MIKVAWARPPVEVTGRVFYSWWWTHEFSPRLLRPDTEIRLRNAIAEHLMASGLIIEALDRSGEPMIPVDWLETASKPVAS